MQMTTNIQEGKIPTLNFGSTQIELSLSAMKMASSGRISQQFATSERALRLDRRATLARKVSDLNQSLWQLGGYISSPGTFHSILSTEEAILEWV